MTAGVIVMKVLGGVQFAYIGESLESVYASIYVSKCQEIASRVCLNIPNFRRQGGQPPLVLSSPLAAARLGAKLPIITLKTSVWLRAWQLSGDAWRHIFLIWLSLHKCLHIRLSVDVLGPNLGYWLLDTDMFGAPLKYGFDDNDDRDDDEKKRMPIQICISLFILYSASHELFCRTKAKCRICTCHESEFDTCTILTAVVSVLSSVQVLWLYPSLMQSYTGLKFAVATRKVHCQTKAKCHICTYCSSRRFQWSWQLLHFAFVLGPNLMSRLSVTASSWKWRGWAPRTCQTWNLCAKLWGKWPCLGENDCSWSMDARRNRRIQKREMANNHQHNSTTVCGLYHDLIWTFRWSLLHTSSRWYSVSRSLGSSK